MKPVSIAVIGATGAVGREFLSILETRDLPLKEIKLCASHRSAGKRIKVLGEELVVEETTPDSFTGVDVAFISVSTALSGEFGPIAVQKGALVIDDSSYFRMDSDVPLVVPEVNGEDVEHHRGIISIPNCSTTPLVMAIHPLNKVNPVRRVVAATYQSVSGAGGAAMDELREQTRTLLDGGQADPKEQPNQIAFNVIPRIDSFGEDGYTKEETKMINETRKIMHMPDMAVSATCVRVPVYISHSAAVHVEFEDPNLSRRRPSAFVRHARSAGRGRPRLWRIPHAFGRRRRLTTCWWAAFERTPPTPTAWQCGLYPTICEREPL